MGARAGPVPPVPLPRLHILTNLEVVSRPGFSRAASAVMVIGGERIVLQLRAPGMAGRALFELARPLVAEARRTGAWLLISDRMDVALACGARGVHLPGHGLQASDARALWSDGVVGASVHTVDEIAGDRVAQLDYLTVGTLFATPSHPDRGGEGTGLIREFSRAWPGLPLVGVGGITPERVPGVRHAGAHGVAVIRSVWGPDSTQEMAVEGRTAALLTALEVGLETV